MVIVIGDCHCTQILFNVVTTESVAFWCDCVVGVMQNNCDGIHQRSVVVTCVFSWLTIDSGAVHVRGNLQYVCFKIIIVWLAKIHEACSSVKNGVTDLRLLDPMITVVEARKLNCPPRIIPFNKVMCIELTNDCFFWNSSNCNWRLDVFIIYPKCSHFFINLPLIIECLHIGWSIIFVCWR